MESASAGDAAGNDFGTLADVFAQAGQILVINAVDAINAEAANLCGRDASDEKNDP